MLLGHAPPHSSCADKLGENNFVRTNIELAEDFVSISRCVCVSVCSGSVVWAAWRARCAGRWRTAAPHTHVNDAVGRSQPGHSELAVTLRGGCVVLLQATAPAHQRDRRRGSPPTGRRAGRHRRRRNGWRCQRGRPPLPAKLPRDLLGGVTGPWGGLCVSAFGRGARGHGRPGHPDRDGRVPRLAFTVPSPANPPAHLMSVCLGMTVSLPTRSKVLTRDGLGPGQVRLSARGWHRCHRHAGPVRDAQRLRPRARVCRSGGSCEGAPLNWCDASRGSLVHGFA